MSAHPRTPRLRKPLRWGALAWVGALLFAPSPADAQAPVGTLVVEPRLGQTGVAISIRFPRGSHEDPLGGEGTAVLLGRVVEAAAAERLAGGSVQVHVEVDRDHTALTLFAPEAGWTEAWAELRRLLTDAPLGESAVQRARDRRVDELLFQTGAPGREFEGLWSQLRLRELDPDGADPGRPLGGSVSSVSGLSAGSLERFRGAHWRWEEAVVAVVGPAGEEEVSRYFTPNRLVQVAGPPPMSEPAEGEVPPSPRVLHAPASTPLRAPSTPPPAGFSERQVADRDITSTWIGVAWLLPEGTPRTLSAFMAHVVREQLNPIPPDPGLYRADVMVESVGGRDLLTLVATVDPQASRAWELRMAGSLRSLALSPPQGAFFDLARRRFRSEALLAAADPAIRAQTLARNLLEGGEPVDLTREVWGLTREALSTLAESAGEPRMLLFGPERMMSQPRPDGQLP
jgi:hypothetical protein